jgi:hypothetical protein
LEDKENHQTCFILMFCVEDAVPGLGRHFLFERFENNEMVE